MTSLSLYNSEQNNYADVLAGTDALEIENVFIHHIAREKILGAAEGQAKKLYLALDDILEQRNGEKVLKERTKALRHDQKVLYAKYLTIRNSCKSAAMVIATRNAKKADNPYDIDHMVGEMKENGVSPEQLAKVIGTITQWKTGTSHPTQHLSDDGKNYFRKILLTNNLISEERYDNVRDAIRSMFDTKITREKRMTVREETQTDRAQAKLHRQAQRKTFAELKLALEKHYGSDAPNLLSDSIRMTLRYHTWNGAGDADGKSNADKKALLEGMVGYTIDAIEEHLNDIKRSIEDDPSLINNLKQTQSSLQTIYDRLSGLERKLLDENDETSFEALKEEFSGVYKGLRVDYEENGNTAVNSEEEMYEKLTKNLRHIINTVAGDTQKKNLEESLFVMRQYKDTFTTAKIEKRAPGPVDEQIVNKMFDDKKFQEAFLNGSMRRNLTNKKFSELSSEDQKDMMNHVGKMVKGDRTKIIKYYRRIFEEGDDKKGFPNQLRERGERLLLQALAPNKFGMSIVAEASEMSAEYSFFLGEQVFGVKNMMHTMLNEDMETLESAPDFLINFSQNGGLTSMMNAVTNNPRLAHYLEKHGAMLPCSDSVKQLGPAAFYMQAQAINLMMKYAVEEGKTICIKWGNGQSLTRGGGNAHVAGRVKAQSVQWYLNGEALNLDNAKHIKILANVMFSSNTEQGRAADFMSPDADRISKNHLNMIGEMLGRTLELTGKSQKGDYIPQVAGFSNGARKVFGEIAKNIMMRGYENYRDAEDENGNRLSDDVADKTSNMKGAADANQASRPGARAEEAHDSESEKIEEPKKSGKALYDLRAIGTTISISHMRTYHDGWFTLGAGLRSMHEAHLNRELAHGDLKALLDDPLWAGMVKNGLRTASMSDMTHAFEKLGIGDWSHNQAMKIGKSVKIISSDDDHKTPLFTFKGEKDGITAEQAYVAKLYYDQALFITYAETLAELKTEDVPMPDKLKHIEQKAELHLDNVSGKIGRFKIGKYTNELFPLVDQDRNLNRTEALPAQILSDVVEDIHDDFSEEEKYALTAAQRSTQTWNNQDSFLDQDAYGSILAQRYDMPCAQEPKPSKPFGREPH